ncbi:UbiE/COQ5 methyltransferase [gamma proteobacterium HdN1]|nr:UbiE/COQ5 methyltransferase [gamma proteobacterium HdN1]
MVKSVLTSVTRPYSSLESFSYDKIIAPAVVQMLEGALQDWSDVLASSKELLDLGCGGGQVLALLAKRYPSLQLSGVDLSYEQVARARKRLDAFSGRAEVKQGSALEIPYPDAHFDTVISIASIKHWPDPQRGLQECVRVLKPGGTLLVVEVDRACTLADAHKFISGWKIPRVFQPFALALFRTWVAGNSPDLLEASELANKLTIDGIKVVRVAGTPAWSISGARRVDAAKITGKPSGTTKRLQK